jgi:hypothetical protein
MLQDLLTGLRRYGLLLIATASLLCCATSCVNHGDPSAPPPPITPAELYIRDRTQWDNTPDANGIYYGVLSVQNVSLDKTIVTTVRWIIVLGNTASTYLKQDQVLVPGGITNYTDVVQKNKDSFVDFKIISAVYKN